MRFLTADERDKAGGKLKETQLKLDAMKMDILSTMPPEQKIAALFPNRMTTLAGEVGDHNGFRQQVEESNTEVLAPEYEPGSGTPPFRPAQRMSVPQQIAQGQVDGSLPAG